MCPDHQVVCAHTSWVCRFIPSARCTLVHCNSYAVIFYACKSSLELRFAQLKHTTVKEDNTGCIFLAQHIACYTLHVTSQRMQAKYTVMVSKLLLTNCVQARDNMLEVLRHINLYLSMRQPQKTRFPGNAGTGFFEIPYFQEFCVS